MNQKEVNEREEAVKNGLVDAWNAFVALPAQHDDDLTDFRRSIHECQRIIATRKWCRDHHAACHSSAQRKMSAIGAELPPLMEPQVIREGSAEPEEVAWDLIDEPDEVKPY